MAEWQTPQIGNLVKDARTLSREILAISDEDFRTAFKGSPMKRAKLGGLKRNAAIVLAKLGSETGIAEVEVETDHPPDSLSR